MIRRFLGISALQRCAMFARATATTGAAAGTAGGRPQQYSGRNQQYQQQQQQRGGNGGDFAYPPSFDLVRPNNENLAAGYMLRVQYLNQCVLFNYMRQIAPTDGAQRNSHFDGQNKIVAFLPTVFIARFLAVLEGASAQCEMAGRTTKGTFSAKSEPHTYVLNCTSQAEGTEPLNWSVEFDAPHALMLQHFLYQALHYNSGFGNVRP